MKKRFIKKLHFLQMGCFMNKKYKALLLAIFVGTSSIFFTSCGKDDGTIPHRPRPPKDTAIVDSSDVKDSSDVEDITSSSSSSQKSSSSSDTKGSSSSRTDSSESSSSAHKAVDYSKGRAMNKRISKGINLGNAWDSACYSDWRESGTPYNYGNNDGLDACWQNL